LVLLEEYITMHGPLNVKFGITQSTAHHYISNNFSRVSV